MPNRQPSLPDPTDVTLPLVDEAVLAEMSGPRGLTPAELWEKAGAEAGTLAAWALSEAEKCKGMSPREAFLAGTGYAITAYKNQLCRDAIKQHILGSFSEDDIASFEEITARVINSEADTNS